MESIADPRSKRPPSLVLATDLDGTFAGGTPEERSRLQRALDLLPGASLIYVTGRCVSAVQELMREAALPHPDLLIADVGTTVAHGETFRPLAEIERDLAPGWPGGDAIRARLHGVPGLEEQDVRVPRRVSWWVTDGDVDAAIKRARSRLAGLDVDLVGSAGVYLDVLPRGVNKGTTLRRVLAWLGRPETDVVVAGDTLNDLALFETGMAGIVVGNGEPALRERVRDREHTYHARAHGAAGILEGLTHFGWIPEASHGQ